MARRKSKGRKPSQAQSAASLSQNGRRFFGQKNYASAIDAWERARQKQPQSVSDGVLAEAYFRRGMRTPMTQASDLEKAAVLQPQDTVYGYHLALLRHRQGKLVEAVAGYEQVQKGGASWRQRVAYPLALAYQQQGKDLPKLKVWMDLSAEEQAMLLTAQAWQQGADLPVIDAPLWHGVEAVVNGRLSEAIPHLEAASQQPVNKGISYYLLGLLAAWAEDWETAVRHWSTARAAGFSTPNMEANLGELYHRAAEARWQQQETESALAAAVEANQFMDNDKQLAGLIAHLHQEVGYKAASEGDWAKALASWQLALEEAGSNFRLACNLALASPWMEPAPMVAAASSSVALCRPVMTTSQPLAARASAMPRPIPSLPPVTRALAPASFISILPAVGRRFPFGRLLSP
jgi:tetratricopeptide (TPR) repeat protein